MRITRYAAGAVVLLSVVVIAIPLWNGNAEATSNKSSRPNPKTKLLTISDMPSGWAVNNSSSSSDTPACLSGIKAVPKGGNRASVDFAQGGSFPIFAEVLTTGPGESARLQALNHGLSTCKSLSLTSDGQTYTGSIGAMSFPKVGDKSNAYAATLSIQGFNVGLDFVLFRSGPYSGAIEYGSIGSPDVSQLHTLVNLALAKIRGTSSSEPKATGSAHVGSTQSISGESGSKANVTVTQVIDPAAGGDQFMTPDAGKRFVAVELTLTNTGASALQGDADSDSTLIGSDNQSYTADFASVSECTNFANGSYQLNAGESATGCVTFQLPNGISPAKFQYSGNGGFGGSFDEWLIP